MVGTVAHGALSLPNFTVTCAEIAAVGTLKSKTRWKRSREQRARDEEERKMGMIKGGERRVGGARVAFSRISDIRNENALSADRNRPRSSATVQCARTRARS